MNTRIKKVKAVEGARVEMVFEKASKSGGWDQFTFSCSDQGRPEFYEAIQDLSIDLAAMCEQKGDVSITGLSLSYAGENETLGAVISGKLELEYSHGAMALNTPHKVAEFQTVDGDPKGLLSEECVKRIYRVIEECNLYIKGERAQGTLFPESVEIIKEAAADENGQSEPAYH